jgi:hypothetical protein
MDISGSVQKQCFKISDLIKGVIIGCLVTSFGFFLTTRLEYYKHNRDIKNNQDISIYILCEELKNNSVLIELSRDFIKKEFDIIKNQGDVLKLNPLIPVQNVLNPLIPLQVGAWDLLKINQPNKFIKKDIIFKINDYNQGIIIVNKLTEIRENYKILNNSFTSIKSNLAYADYQTNLKNYNYLLNERLKELNNRILEINQSLLVDCKRVNPITN